MQEVLRELLKKVAPYPKGVIPVTDVIPGMAFFPGGNGLWMEDGNAPVFPNGGIMVLGHNFDSEKNYRKSLEQRRENVESNPTWRNLINLLRSVDVNPNDVFFTNFYMGLIKGEKNTGKFPGASDAEFVALCGQFFIEQLVFQKPKIVLTLGTAVPPLIAPFAKELHGWRNVNSFSKIDQFGSLFRNVRFSGANGAAHTTTIATLTHPCLRNSNVRHRSYAGRKGKDAEHQLLADVLS